MSINNIPDIGPYTELKPFRFWCQKVMPLVYDESLSYYELLCKVVDYLNKTMEDVDNMIDDMGEFRDAYEELVSYVNNYFDNLDVQEEINNKLDAMAEAGYFNTLFNTLFRTDLIAKAGDVTSAWIAANLLQETGYVIDDSLSIANAAADAAATGYNIRKLNAAIFNRQNFTWEQGTINSASGNSGPSTTRVRVPYYINIEEISEIISDGTYMINVFWYSAAEYTSYISTTGFLADHNYSIIDNKPATAKFIKVVLRDSQSTSTEFTPSDVSADAVYYYSPFYRKRIFDSEMTHEIIKKWNVGFGNSGACFAEHDDIVEVWSFNAVPDDHLTDGACYKRRYYPETKTFGNDTMIRHTLGHVNSVSYNKEKNALICGNGGSDYLLPGEIIIIENATTKTAFNYSDALVIEFSSYGAKVNAIWGNSGDNDNMVYVITNDGYDIYKIILGEDDNILDLGHQSKLTGFNGTFKILNHWEYGDTKSDYANVVQGAFYDGSGIGWGFGHNTPTVPIHYIIPKISGDVETKGIITSEYNADGTESTHSICSGAYYDDMYFTLYSTFAVAVKSF